VATITDASNMKWTGLSEYPTKGRSTMGVRCQTFKKDDARITTAVVAAEVSGPTSPAAKRDASGAPFDGELFAAL
jgi:hypothetical protein